MQPWWIILALVGGFAAGAVTVWLFWRGRVRDLAAAAAAGAREEEARRQAEPLAELRARLAEAQARLEAEQRQAGEKLKLLDEAKRQLADQFKVLANEIFDDKSKKFTQASGERLDTLLKPLGEKLKEFSQRVEDTHEKGVRERATIKQLIESLTEKNQLLGAEAHNLANALRGEAKTQGNWGEMVLERVLAASGLEKGLAFEVQASHLGEDGRRFQPDVVVRLPDHKCLVIDAKVSLVAYERYTAAEAGDEAREPALREHIQSLRNHIKSLGDKEYHNLPGLTTPDFIFMFVPIESAWNLALREEAKLFEEASQRKIIIVTPSTLLASLRLINYLWQQEKQSRHAAEIAQQAGKLYDKLADFVAELEQVGARLDQAGQSYEQAMKRLSTGRGNALALAAKIRELGAPAAKDLPGHLLADDTGAKGDASS